jgi:hypothetical protein
MRSYGAEERRPRSRSRSANAAAVPLHMASLAAVLVVLLLSDAAQGPAPTRAEWLSLARKALPNLHVPTAGVYVGGEPAGPEGFEWLTRLGVRVIVSVDGVRPDVQTARRYGLRYVHIPIGYEGIGPRAGSALTQVLRELHGPFYFHCHHGKHRAPAAAAVACIGAGLLTNEQGTELLRMAGTSKDYPGLWRDVAKFQAPTGPAARVELHDMAPVSSFTAEMATLDRLWDRLLWCQEAGWKTRPDHPDLVPEREALLVYESLRELHRLARTEATGPLPEPFRSLLQEAEQLAAELRTAVKQQDHARADRLTRALEERCDRCHLEYRDLKKPPFLAR